jgi:hypothetical protein
LSWISGDRRAAADQVELHHLLILRGRHRMLVFIATLILEGSKVIDAGR